MIVRPLQPAVVGPDQAQEKRAIAMKAIAPLPLVEHVNQTDEFIVKVPEGSSEEAVARKLMATGAFQYAEPDWIVYPIACPNDTHFSLQWAHQANRMNSCAGWDLHTGNSSVTVGICDTGIRTTHEDLLLHRKEGYNAVDRLWESNGGAISPVHNHGTRTTGCAAANGNNGKGVTGVGWNLSHRMMRVSNLSTGSAALSTLQHAARTSVESGDKVANVSYSGADSSSNLTTATYIKSIGGLLCWAAGNDGRNLTFGNRDNDDLIVVGASNSSDVKASFSAFGSFVDLVAPGESVATTSSESNSSYVYASGTSFASPKAAGLVALIWSANPSLTPNQVESMLKSTCDDLGSSGIDNTYGYGRINTLKAMQAATGGTAPTAEFVGTPTSGTVPLTVQFTDQSTGAPTSWAWTFGDGGSSTSQNPSHTYNSAGTYTVVLTAANANGNDTRTRVGYITVNSVTNQPPTANAGPDQTITLPSSATLNGSVSDDGLPSNTLTSTWSTVSGPGTVTFGNANAASTTASFSVAGTYVLRLTADDSALTASDDVTVTVNPANNNPVRIAFDDLENGSSGGSGWSGPWLGGGDSRITKSGGPHSGRRHIRLRRSTGYAQREVNLAGVSNVSLIFWAKLNSFESGDTAAVQISTDGGSTFTTIRTFVNGEDDNTYRRYEIPVASVSSQTVVRFDANMDNRRDYFYVDDVELIGVR